MSELKGIGLAAGLLEAENAQLRGIVVDLNQKLLWYDREIADLKIVNAELVKGIEEYACTGSDTPCGCYNLLSQEKELRGINAQLLAAVKPLAVPDKVSLIDTLGHIGREDIERARAAVTAAG